MKLFAIALLCLVVPTLGAPQPGILQTIGKIGQRVLSPFRRLINPNSRRRQVPTVVPRRTVPTTTVPRRTFTRVETAFGVLSLENGARNSIPQEEKDIYLPVMKALLKVMESNSTAPEDVNDLLVLTRDLTKDLPEGANDVISLFNDLDFVEDVEGMFLPDIGDGVLPEDGDVIVQFKESPYILTQFGAFPLSELSLMTDDERELLLPVARNFVSVLEKDTVSQDEIEELAEQSKILNDLIPEQFREIITSIIDKELNGVGGSVIEA